MNVCWDTEGTLNGRAVKNREDNFVYLIIFIFTQVHVHVCVFYNTYRAVKETRVILDCLAGLVQTVFLV